MTVYVCEECSRVIGCIDVETTHLMLCRVENNTCPCVGETSFGTKLTSCFIHNSPEKFNHLYFEPKGLCRQCFWGRFMTEFKKLET